MHPNELQQRLNAFPRLNYCSYPTPLERLQNLERRLGGPHLWIKRDDGIGPALGGNKGRKLEFLMAQALEMGRRKVVTFGGPQSNHARMTAAACAALDLEAHLLFFARRPPRLDGNLLLNRLCGANLHFIPLGGGDGSMTLATTNRLVRLLSLLVAGPGAYFIPVGGHNVRGCLGYVQAALEVSDQVREMGLPPRQTTLVTAAGTGGTLGGLMAGLALLGSPLRVLGIDIGKLWKGFPASIGALAEALCTALGGERRFAEGHTALVEHTYAGAGYARPTEIARRAIYQMAGAEGILLDPIYTGKAFAGLLDLARKDLFGPEEHVVFLHTGGLPGLWAQELDMQEAAAA